MAGSKMTRRTKNRLRAWRAREGLTLEEVADLTGLSPSMLSRAERGIRELRPRNKVKIARCLEVPIRELFDVVEPPDSSDEDVDPVVARYFDDVMRA